jgi:hypothetical protein
MASELKQIQKILQTIDGAVTKFTDGLPDQEKEIYGNLLKLLKRLEVDRLGNIKNNLSNIRLLSDINKEVNAIVQSDAYSAKVAEFVNVYKDISKLQNQYLSTVFDKFKPTKVLREITKASIEITVDQMTENGVTNLLAGELKDILKQNITSGASYSDMASQIENAILGNDEIDGGMTRYAKQIAVDAVNQYNATYTKQVTSDFDAKWFRYTGSLMETSREFCRALKDKDGGYYHISEIPGFLEGTVGDEQVEISRSTGLPKGMNENTNVDNFSVLRGGWNCGHQIFPVSKASVPESLLAKFPD